MAAPRVAATQPACRQPASPQRAVTLEGIEGVIRTARHETAGRIPVREDALIRPHQSVERARRQTHGEAQGRRRSIIVVRSCACDQPSSDAVTRIKRSPGGGRFSVSRSRSRSTAWIRRRIRFRTTAPPTLREIANATRKVEDVVARYCNRTGPRPALAPSARSRARARRLESPAITRPDGSDPSDAVTESRLGHREYSSGRGTRASCVACGHWADTDASSLLPQRTNGSGAIPGRVGPVGAVGAVDDDDHSDPT